MDTPIQPIRLFDPARLPPRDEDGFTEHPDLAQFYDKPFNTEDEGFIDTQALAREGLESAVIEFEHDAPIDLQDAWFGEGAGDCSSWQPSHPNGEGWMLAGIWDTEDGPVAFYVRPLVAA